MKTASSLFRSLLLALAALLPATGVFAGQPVLLRIHSMYNGPLPYIVFGVVIALILYVGYRYLHDGSSLNE